MSPPERLEIAIERARDGEESAWDVIYAELAPPVLGYLRSRRAPLPEDALGEVMVQVVRDFGSFEGDSAGFRAWVMTIAHHRLLDAKRTYKRKPPPEPLEDEGAAEHGIGDVEEEAVEGLAYERMLGLLAQLTEDQQTVLTLRIIGDLSVEEVAAAMGKRPGAVKTSQRRALAALRRLLERDEVSPGRGPALQKEES